MDKHDIIVRISFVPKNALTNTRGIVQSETMPQLRLTGDGVPTDSLTRLIDQYGEWLLISGDSERYVEKAVRGCRKVSLDLGWLQPSDISDDRMLEYLNKLKASGRKSKTRNHYRNYLYGFCGWLKLKKHLDMNPMELVPEAKVLDKTPRAVPEVAQVGHLIQIVKRVPRKKDRWLVYTLAASTGLRHEELKKLTAGMYRDGDHPHFDIPPTHTKSQVRQLAFIPTDVNCQLREHLNGRSDSDPVVRAVPSWDSFECDRKLAGLPKVDKSGSVFSFHSFRHYFSNRLSEAGVDLEYRAKLMRHGGLGVTADTYTLLNRQRMSEKINSATFFPVDTAPDPPIHYLDTTEPDAMNTPARFRGGGSNPLTPIEPTNNPSNEQITLAGGGVVAVSDNGTRSSDTNKSDDSGEGGTILSHNCGDYSLSSPQTTSNGIDRPESSSLPMGLPDSDSIGLRPSAAPLNTPTRSIDDMLAQAFLAGVRVGRGISNGDTHES